MKWVPHPSLLPGEGLARRNLDWRVSGPSSAATERPGIEDARCAMPEARARAQSQAQLHREENQNKQRSINNLSSNPVPNQRISQKSVQFSCTLYLDEINSLIPKSLKW
jgi:hypothetical protein